MRLIVIDVADHEDQQLLQFLAVSVVCAPASYVPFSATEPKVRPSKYGVIRWDKDPNNFSMNGRRRGCLQAGFLCRPPTS